MTNNQDQSCLTRRDFLRQSTAAAGFLFALSLASLVQGQQTAVIEKDVPERGFFSTIPAERWEEALLCGNGKMGALVMSRTTDETIILTHERLFLPLEDIKPPGRYRFTFADYPQIGQRREIQRCEFSVIFFGGFVIGLCGGGFVLEISEVDSFAVADDSGPP